MSILHPVVSYLGVIPLWNQYDESSFQSKKEKLMLSKFKSGRRVLILGLFVVVVMYNFSSFFYIFPFYCLLQNYVSGHLKRLYELKIIILKYMKFFVFYFI